MACNIVFNTHINSTKFVMYSTYYEFIGKQNKFVVINVVHTSKIVIKLFVHNSGWKTVRNMIHYSCNSTFYLHQDRKFFKCQITHPIPPVCNWLMSDSFVVHRSWVVEYSLTSELRHQTLLHLWWLLINSSESSFRRDQLRNLLYKGLLWK